MVRTSETVADRSGDGTADAGDPAASRSAKRSAILAAAIALGLVVLSALFLFVDAQTVPVRLWDESRNIVNALEMHRRGFQLFTTYAGEPDLWNTKPPLLIWLMAASVGAFGASEAALRLPSMIAALGTVLLLFWFVRHVTSSIATATVSAALIVLSPALFGEHSARTADYDALLLFFVTAYLCLIFLAVHHARPPAALLLLLGAAIVCAVLTKSVAALVPASGVAFYLVATGRWRRLWSTPGYWVTALGVAAILAALLLLRERASPGYLQAAWWNDVGGRFGSSLVVLKSRWFYLNLLQAGYFAATPLLLLAPIGLWYARGGTRGLLGYALCIVVATLVVFTCAASKLHHYILPALPFMAIAAAITCRFLLDRARGAWATDTRQGRLVAATLMLIAIGPLAMGAAAAVARRYYVASPGEGARSGHYGPVFAKIAPVRDRPILVVDPGFVLDGSPHYAPVLLAYRQIWAARGVAIAHATDLAAARSAQGVLLVSCDAEAIAAILARGRDIAGVAGCAAVATPRAR